MTDLIPVRKGKSTQVTLVDLQDRLDARKQIEATRTTTSTKKSRLEQAHAAFKVDPLKTLVEIQDLACDLADVFDAAISLDSIPLDQAAVDRLSNEFVHIERLKERIAALETRYKTLVFAHLDETGPKIPGRPASQVPGKVEAQGPGPRYIFERRGGNRENPDLDTVGLKNELPEHLVAEIFATVHHEPVAAWDEEVFDEGRFGELVEEGKIDLDLVARYLTPGKWRTPAFYKTLVDGDQ